MLYYWNFKIKIRHSKYKLVSFWDWIGLYWLMYKVNPKIHIDVLIHAPYVQALAEYDFHIGYDKYAHDLLHKYWDNTISILTSKLKWDVLTTVL